MNYIDKIAEIDEYLKKNISSKRYNHSVEVAKMASKIAKKFNIDHHKTYFSGLAHDIAREIPIEKQESIIKEFDDLSKDFLSIKSIHHGPVGSYLVKKKFQITDKSVLEGIKYHSVGYGALSDIGKCVFVADYISEDRDHITREFRDKVLQAELDRMVYWVLLEMKSYLISQGKKMTKESIELFNLVNR